MPRGRCSAGSSRRGHIPPRSSTGEPSCSPATVEGVWRRLPPAELAILTALLLGLLGLILAAAALLGHFGRFPAPSRAAILFCGSVKSLASGAPMARILFPGAAAGLVI